MIRTVLLCLAPLILLPGCGEPEQPRFVPATGSDPATSPDETRAKERSSREATIPKNIETH